MSDRTAEIEKDYVFAKGCFADVLLVVIGGPLLFFAISVVLWFGLVFWPVVVVAIGAIAFLLTNRAKQGKASRQALAAIVAAREALPNDVPGDGRTWVV